VITSTIVFLFSLKTTAWETIVVGEDTATASVDRSVFHPVTWADDAEDAWSGAENPATTSKVSTHAIK
jgi:hypothetical protein